MKKIKPQEVDVRILVLTRTAVVNGKPTEISILSVIDKDGNVEKEVSSEGMSGKEFNKKIYEIQSEYGIRRCTVERKNLSGNVRHF